MKNERYDWIPFYEEFAQKLWNYKEDRVSLFKKLENVRDISEQVKKIHQEVGDIDPFTIMGIIHKRKWPDGDDSDGQRKNILQEIRGEFRINAALPSSNFGIPDLGSGDIRYYNKDAKKIEKRKNIQVIWNLFDHILNYASVQEKQLQNPILDDMQKVIDIKHNRISKVTMAIYWSAPKVFLSLDSKNYSFIMQDNGNLFSNEIIRLTKLIFSDTKNHDKGNIEYYFDLLDQIHENLKTNSVFHSFPELSRIAYISVSSEEGKENSTSVNHSEDNEISTTLEGGKNIIVYGVPGSGKSYYIENYIKKQLKDEKEYRECVERVIFYPEYTYYDFVGQNVPNKNGGLDFEPGNFTKILQEALKHEKKKYYLVIEELNRGNAEAIFGDIFQLLDRKPSGESTYSIDNNSLKDYFKKKSIPLKEKEIKIPANLTIYATINNADQNVFNFDTAFGRRWDYKMMPCNPEDENEDNTKGQLFKTGYIKGTDIQWNDLRTKINTIILDNKNEIYNAEEKRLGLYYINLEWLTDNDHEKNDEVVKAFAAKLFRYLYLNVFKNNIELMFRDVGHNILEEYIEKFVKEKKISSILKIEAISEESTQDEED